MEFKRYILLVAAVLALSNVGKAQSEKVEAARVSFITTKVNITPSEGQSFWPVYNEFNDKVKAARKSFKSQYHAQTEFKTDKEAEDFLNAEVKLKQTEADLQKEYIEKFKKVLGPKKTALLRKAEEEFKRKLIETIKGNGNDS